MDPLSILNNSIATGKDIYNLIQIIKQTRREYRDLFPQLNQLAMEVDESRRKTERERTRLQHCEEGCSLLEDRTAILEDLAELLQQMEHGEWKKQSKFKLFMKFRKRKPDILDYQLDLEDNQKDIDRLVHRLTHDHVASHRQETRAEFHRMYALNNNSNELLEDLVEEVGHLRRSVDEMRRGSGRY